MAVCETYRIPHADFLSWSKDSRDKAIWWQARRNSTCQSCGTRPEEFDEERGGIHAYVWDVDHCRGCELRAQGQDHLDRAGKKGGAYRRGSFVTLRRHPGV